MDDFRWIALAPGHFHAALVFQRPIPGVARTVHVYAPPGPELVAYLQTIVGFHTRADNPIALELEVHASPDYAERCFRERPGDAVVIAGRNRGKIGLIERAVESDLHVLTDKPLILDSADLPRLAALLDRAAGRGLVVHEMLTERYEVTSQLQRELVNAPEVIDTLLLGSPEAPSVRMESVHFLKKRVAGQPLRRPPWFFDLREYGEGLTDVGHHLVDLVAWMLDGDRADVRLLAAERWPTVVSGDAFREVTGLVDFPPELAADLRDGALPYFCNNAATYLLGGVHVRVGCRWEYESLAGGGDTHQAEFVGSRARVAVRQGDGPHDQPELFVTATDSIDRSAVLAGLRRWLAGLQGAYPGVAVAFEGDEFRVTVSDALRVGHEAHFAQVAEQFLASVRGPGTLPARERAHMLARYALTTRGVELARSHP